MNRSAYLALAGAALLWSGNFIVGRALRDDITPVTLNFWRWVLALAVLLVIDWRAFAAAQRALRREWRLVTAIGLTGVAGFHTCVYLALRDTVALNALLLLAATPIAIMLLSWATSGTRFTSLQKAGAAASLMGAAYLVVRGEPSALLALQANRGDLWMLAAVGIWAVYSILLQRRPADLSPSVLVAGSAVTGVAWMAPLYAVELARGRGGFELSAAVLGGLAYVAVAASVLAFVLWARGQAVLGPSRAGQFLHLMPIFGAILSVLFLGEGIAPYHVGGAMLVFAGIALAQARGRRQIGA